MTFARITTFLLAATAISLASAGIAQQDRKPAPARAAPVAKDPGADGPSQAQPSQAQPSQPQPPTWATRCSSASRQAPLDCAMEQRAVLSQTGQLVVLFSVRVPGDGRQPAALLQLPLGLNLGNGIKLQVDESKPLDIPLQTCEQQGCFAGLQISPELLESLRKGKQLKVMFQNLAQERLAVPLPLNDFATYFDRIR